jgi:hypothetical protein
VPAHRQAIVDFLSSSVAHVVVDEVFEQIGATNALFGES